MRRAIFAAVSALTLSAAGMVSIVQWEGYRGESYTPIAGDRPTIGFGSTYNVDGSPVRPGQTTDPVTALAVAQGHLQQTEAALKGCIAPNVYMTQHQWDAVVSWAYNVGSQAACTSTLVRKLNAGDGAGACEELARWVYSGGRQVDGLQNRRDAERALCLRGLEP